MRLRWFAAFKVSALALGVSLALGVACRTPLLLWLIDPARHHLESCRGCFVTPGPWTAVRAEVAVVLGVAWLPALPFVVFDAWRLLAPPRAQPLRVPLALATTIVAVTSLLLARQLAWQSLEVVSSCTSLTRF